MSCSTAGITPTLRGRAVFGDPEQLLAAPFVGTVAQEDAFLCLPAGTTLYYPCGSVGVATRVLNGPAAATIRATQLALAGMAMANGQMLLPTPLTFRGWELAGSCWFGLGDLAFRPAGIVAGLGGHQLSCAMTIRRTGELAT